MGVLNRDTADEEATDVKRKAGNCAAARPELKGNESGQKPLCGDCSWLSERARR